MEINTKTYLRVDNLKNKENVNMKVERNDGIKGINAENEKINTSVTNKDNVENEKNYKRNEMNSTQEHMKRDNNEEKIKDAIEIINKLLHKQNSKIQVENHDFFKNDIMIKIIDEDTGDVLAEVPPKKILDMIATMVEMAEGIVIDKKA